jgi:hypothetical protein
MLPEIRDLLHAKRTHDEVEIRLGRFTGGTFNATIQPPHFSKLLAHTIRELGDPTTKTNSTDYQLGQRRYTQVHTRNGVFVHEETILQKARLQKMEWKSSSAFDVRASRSREDPLPNLSDTRVPILESYDQSRNKDRWTFEVPEKHLRLEFTVVRTTHSKKTLHRRGIDEETPKVTYEVEVEIDAIEGAAHAVDWIQKAANLVEHSETPVAFFSMRE